MSTSLSSPSPSTVGASPSRDDDHAQLHRLVRRLHFYAGVLVGPFLLVAAVTGFLYALAPQAEKVLHRTETTATSSAQSVSVADQVTTGQAARPGLKLSSVIPGTDGRTTTILFDDPKQPSASYHPAVFVDPATGEVRGRSTLYGSGLAFPERAWLSELHRRLHLGEPGRLYSELAASWLAPVTAAGLVLWWGRRRTATKVGAAGSRSRIVRRHSTVGVVASVGLFFLAATGLTWSTYAGANVASLRESLSWTTPKVATPLTAASGAAAASDSGGGHEGHAGHGGSAGPTAEKSTATAQETAAQLATVDAGARQAGLAAPYEITPAKSDREAWVVKQVRRSYVAGPGALAINPTTGVVTASLPFASYPLAAKLTDWGIRAHMGFLFGVVNQVLLAALAVALTYLVVAGYRMWWKRRPTRSQAFLAMGRAPRRGALVRLARRRPVTVACAGVAVIGTCWAVPLLGVSLVGFLAVDLLLSARTRRAV